MKSRRGEYEPTTVFGSYFPLRLFKTVEAVRRPICRRGNQKARPRATTLKPDKPWTITRERHPEGGNPGPRPRARTRPGNPKDPGGAATPPHRVERAVWRPLIHNRPGKPPLGYSSSRRRSREVLTEAVEGRGGSPRAGPNRESKLSTTPGAFFQAVGSKARPRAGPPTTSGGTATSSVLKAPPGW